MNFDILHVLAMFFVLEYLARWWNLLISDRKCGPLETKANSAPPRRAEATRSSGPEHY